MTFAEQVSIFDLLIYSHTGQENASDENGPLIYARLSEARKLVRFLSEIICVVPMRWLDLLSHYWHGRHPERASNLF